jgi:polyadenylate-binding protein
MIPTQPTTPFQSASLYVGDLHPDITEGFLFEMFNRVGPVASIRVCRDTVTRRSLGYAYVNFHNVQDAERALDTMNFTDIKSRPCRIMWSQRDPSIRKSGVGNVFVKNLASTVDNKGLFDFFSTFGNILSCKVATDEAGESKGYGYVHYDTAEAAQEAIQKISGQILEDQEVFVGTFLRRQDRASTNAWTNLYVKNFPREWSEDNLAAVFTPFGVVSSLKLVRDRDNNSLGFGFVDFAAHESAKAALDEINEKFFEIDATTAESFTMYVNQAQKKIDRERELKAKMDAAKSEQITKFQGMNLFVKNLDETITDDSYRELFTPFGTITSTRIMREPSGASRGFAFVCFSTAEEATRAITEMNGKMIGSKPLFVAMHQRKELRQQYLMATHGPRNGNGPSNNGNGLRFPMQGAPMGYAMNMGYPGGPMPPRQPFPMMGGMMGRGGPMNMGGPRGYPMPNYSMGMGMNMNQQQVQRTGRPNQQVVSNPINNQNRQRVQPQQQPRGQPVRGVQQGQQVRGAQQGGAQQGQNVKYTNQVRNVPQGQQQAQTVAASNQAMSLNSSNLTDLLASADPQAQKNIIGEYLYPLILRHENELAGKITGMLLEMENAELLHLIESPEALLAKIKEALSVLHAHSS